MKVQDVLDHLAPGLTAWRQKHAAAQQLGVTPEALYAWEQRGIPRPRQFQIEVLTGGALRAVRDTAPGRGSAA